MNIALPAVFLIIIVLPGMIFRRKFREGTWPIPPRKHSIPQHVVEALVAAAMLHLIWLHFASWWPGGPDPDLTLVSELLYTGVGSGEAGDVLGKRLASSIGPGAGYFISLYFFSYGAGIALHHGVRSLRLDVLLALFRIDNPWFYLFSGDQYGVPDQSVSILTALREPRRQLDRWQRVWEATRRERQQLRNGEAALFITVQAVQEIAGESFLYVGLLEEQEWYFDRDGELDRLILQQVARRRLSVDQEEPGDDSRQKHHGPLSHLDDPRFYQLDTDYFVLEMSEVSNLSVQWTRVVLETDED